MVEVTFVSRAKHFVPLALLRHLAGSSSTEPSTELEYIGSTGLKSIKGLKQFNVIFRLFINVLMCSVLLRNGTREPRPP